MGIHPPTLHQSNFAPVRQTNVSHAPSRVSVDVNSLNSYLNALQKSDHMRSIAIIGLGDKPFSHGVTTSFASFFTSSQGPPTESYLLLSPLSGPFSSAPS